MPYKTTAYRLKDMVWEGPDYMIYPKEATVRVPSDYQWDKACKEIIQYFENKYGNTGRLIDFNATQLWD